jgi:GTP cyclohydrolase I
MIDRERLIAIGHDLMAALGQDATDPSLAETPRRWADWWVEFLDYEDSKTATVFETVRYNQMVVVSGIRVWSLCEHHLLPFWCDLTMAYITEERLLGLSKFARIAHLYAKRLQVQERLVTNIADHLQEVTGAKSVAVIGAGEHLCMTTRGIRTPAIMSSSVLRGLFYDDDKARQELFELQRQAQKLA